MKTETRKEKEELSIVTYPSDTLRQKADEIREVDQETVDLANKLVETMFRAEGIGLAAPQIGVRKRIIAMDVDEDFHVLINPEVVDWSDDEELIEEGCLSLPGANGEVSRSTGVEVKGVDPEGREKKLHRTGLPARVLLHEIDHLDGTLFIDRMTEAARSLLLKEYKKEKTESTS
ncbi:MAG: peptide deformylase [Candidatus Bipolaricaulota bacterium]